VASVPERLETARLVLRTWRADDLEPFVALNADARVMAHVGTRRALNRDDSERLLAQITRHWDEHGYGLWAVERRAEGTAPIGFVGLAVPSFLPAVLPAVEVGWRLAAAWWGRGYATEAARASVECAWAALHLQRLVSIIHPANERSLRVAAKLGMRGGRDRRLPGTSERLRVMELDAPR
jgi:RimJ/RimL family protein N-acetyltransferase